MARSSVAIEEDINEVLDTVAPELEDETTGLVVDDEPYKIPSEAQIPIPKRLGLMWKEKINKGIEAIEPERAKWDCVFDLFRRCGAEANLDMDNDYKYHHKNSADENIIRVVVQQSIRATYMKNPHIEFSGANDEMKGMAEILEKLINFVQNKASHPGINLKPKAKRWLLHAFLTNFGVLKLDFQDNEGSADEAIATLGELEKKLQNAKEEDEINQIYAQIEIIYEDLPLLRQKGMDLDTVLPHKLIVDPDCTYMNLSDAKWCAEEVDIDRHYIEQKFMKENEEGQLTYITTGRVVSAPTTKETHTADAEKEKIVNQVLGATSDDRRDVIEAGKVRCYYVYDKILRRIYLFSSENWKDPLEVYEDNLGLSRFFPFFILSLGEPVDGIVQPGEISQIVGADYEINKINRKLSFIRNVVFGAVLFDKKQVDSEEVEKLIRHMENPEQVKAFGIGKDSEGKISELLEVLQPPAMDYPQMFDDARLRGTIDRAMNQSEVERGGQFRTNTTNKAVEAYSDIRQQSTQSVTDIIEEVLEELAWAISELFVSKYSPPEIAEILGPKAGDGFKQMSVSEFNASFNMVLAAGSIEKPTSLFKRKEAIEIAQAIGQLGQGAPNSTLALILRLFSSAFSGLQVTEEDFERIAAEGQSNMQKGRPEDGKETPQSGQRPPRRSGPANQ